MRVVGSSPTQSFLIHKLFIFDRGVVWYVCKFARDIQEFIFGEKIEKSELPYQKSIYTWKMFKSVTGRNKP